jgi:hypothetical protein
MHAPKPISEACLRWTARLRDRRRRPAERRERSAVLDEQCEAIGRDPGRIVCSVQLPVSYDDPASTRETLGQLVGAGFSHLVLNLAAPYPNHVARWVADELIIPTRGHLDHAQ